MFSDQTFLLAGLAKFVHGLVICLDDSGENIFGVEKIGRLPNERHGKKNENSLAFIFAGYLSAAGATHAPGCHSLEEAVQSSAAKQATTEAGRVLGGRQVVSWEVEEPNELSISELGGQTF